MTYTYLMKDGSKRVVRKAPSDKVERINKSLYEIFIEAMSIKTRYKNKEK